MTTGKHVNINSIHPFWARCYIHIPLKDRGGKVCHPRAYQGHFVGYLYTSTLCDNFIILEVLDDGKYGKIRHSKDVIFDDSINYVRPDPNTFPEDHDFHPLELEPLYLTPDDTDDETAPVPPEPELTPVPLPSAPALEPVLEPPVSVTLPIKTHVIPASC